MPKKDLMRAPADVRRAETNAQFFGRRRRRGERCSDQRAGRKQRYKDAGICTVHDGVLPFDLPPKRSEAMVRCRSLHDTTANFAGEVCVRSAYSMAQGRAPVRE